MRLRNSLTLMLMSGASFLVVAGLWAAPQEPKQEAAKVEHPAGPDEPAPPPNQTYIGTTKCGSCHFDKYQDWRKQQDKHVKAFQIVPAAYQADPGCLKCHTTGFGQPSGFKTPEDRTLAGITCEACHGPGSAHAEISKPFANKKNLPPEQDKIARDSIYRVLPHNVCVTCHTARSHKQHPDYKKQ